jgi:uncharacterized protein (DUF4415 family)
MFCTDRVIGYRTRINDTLRAFVESQQTPG